MDRSVKKALLSVKKAYKPERMIVFGSQARGDTHEGSDVDVIIVKKTRRRFLDRIGDVLELWKGRQPLEPIIYTPGEFQKMTEFSDFVKTAVKEGVDI